MFAKLTQCLSTGVSNFTDFSQKQMLRVLSKKYPDFLEVLDVLEALDGPEKGEVDGATAEVEDDGRWRPMLLTMGNFQRLVCNKLVISLIWRKTR